MKDDKKLARLLQFYLLISGNHSYTIPELEEEMDMCERSIWNYIKIFEDKGFKIRFDGSFKHYIDEYPYKFNDIENYMYISPLRKEAIIEGISGLSDQNPLKRDLLNLMTDKPRRNGRKIKSRRNYSQNLETLRQAIERQEKVVLIRYESSNSHTIRDRVVEPHLLCDEYYGVKAYDIEDMKDKMFKISRIEKVKRLHEPWENEHFHRNIQDDCFQMSGTTNEHIRLRMTLRAKNLLIEEYPETEDNITREGDCWILETDILSPEGAARFIQGLNDDIVIEEGVKLHKYILNKMIRQVKRYRKEEREFCSES